MTTVATVMHRGLISCRPDAPFVAVARTMAAHRIHCVVVPDHGIVTDLELAAALDGSVSATAAELARAAPTLDESDSLERAASVFRQHAATHALVCDRGTGRVTGVLSALDLADAFAAR
jgi:CBS domain-containing protein